MAFHLIQSMGLGGGFFMTIWDAKNKKADYLDARETAPEAATKDMFDSNAHLAMYGRIFSDKDRRKSLMSRTMQR